MPDEEKPLILEEAPAAPDLKLEPETPAPEPAPKVRKPRAAKLNLPDDEKKPPAVPKKTNKKKSSKNAHTSDEVTTLIEGLHAMAELWISPAAHIDHGDAARMGEATFTVIETYELWWLLDFGPLAAFAATTLAVEAPIIMAVRMDLRNRKAAREAAKNGNGSAVDGVLHAFGPGHGAGHEEPAGGYTEVPPSAR